MRATASAGQRNLRFWQRAVGSSIAHWRQLLVPCLQRRLPPTPTPVAPVAPTLVYPGKPTHVPGPSITYRWNASAGATMYWLTVSTSSNASDTSKFKFNGLLGNVTQYTNTAYTNSGKTYYWWVNAGNSIGWATQAEVLANGCWFINGP